MAPFAAYYSFARLMSASLIAQIYSMILPGQIAGDIAKAYDIGKGRDNPELIVASVLVDKLTG